MDLEVVLYLMTLLVLAVFLEFTLLYVMLVVIAKTADIAEMYIGGNANGQKTIN